MNIHNIKYHKVFLIRHVKCVVGLYQFMERFLVLASLVCEAILCLFYSYALAIATIL